MLPQVAQPAIQGGRHVAKQIVRRLGGAPTEPFRYHDKGTMATIGRNDAVTELPTGCGCRVARLAGVARTAPVYLVGFRNRANVLLNWAWNYFTYDRHSRIVAARDVARARTRTAAPVSGSRGRSATPRPSPPVSTS